jgi:peptidoglycan/xylan/chitin deacetylase (PgdA/CDA1 family)
VKRVVVLMYHALYADDRELAAIDAADRPYAVSVAAFERQLDAVARAGIAVIDPVRLPARAPVHGGVVLTFDDGHESNHRHACRMLLARGLRAAFFVTSDFIDGRAGFCRWPQLREMAENGMTIGSHGRSHAFFDDLDNAQAGSELRDSRRRIEDAIGRPVAQLSFPGGRFLRRQLSLAADAGYTLYHTSRFGSHRPDELRAHAVLSRVAIRRSTDERQFVAYATAAPWTMRRAAVAGSVKGWLRAACGNAVYQRLYEKLRA